MISLHIVGCLTLNVFRAFAPIGDLLRDEGIGPSTLLFIGAITATSE